MPRVPDRECVVSFSVAQRAREIGIRIPLGARRRHILTLTLREVLARTAQGVVMGMALSFGANRALASFLYGVGTYDLRPPVAVAFIVAAVTIIAAVGTVYRATLSAPMLAIRREWVARILEDNLLRSCEYGC